MGPFWRVTLALATGWLVVTAVLSLLQKSFIYFPARAPEALLLREAPHLGLEPWRDPGGALIGWQTPLAPSRPPLARLLVFHGNAGYAQHRTYYAALAPSGWQVQLFEYPGYGARPGTPAEEVIRPAALAALDSLAGPDQPPLVLAGESLGSGVAAWAASQRPEAIAGLVLITPMTSLVDVASRIYPFLPVHLFLTERYDSLTALRGYRGPAAFVLAGRDEIIPVDLGRRLFASYHGPKRIWEQSGAGHNSLDFRPHAWESVFAFLAAASSSPPGNP